MQERETERAAHVVGEKALIDIVALVELLALELSSLVRQPTRTFREHDDSEDAARCVSMRKLGAPKERRVLRLRGLLLLLDALAARLVAQRLVELVLPSAYTSACDEMADVSPHNPTCYVQECTRVSIRPSA